MTYRERRIAKAERLRDWAEKRESRAVAVYQDHERYHGDHAFNFQPANPNTQLARQRRKVNAQAGRAFEDTRKAEAFSARADGIERATDRAIYSDDPDAADKLRKKIAGLEAQREQIKLANSAYRREHKAELKTMTPYQRDHAMPYRGYVLTNLNGNLNRCKKRLAGLER